MLRAAASLPWSSWPPKPACSKACGPTGSSSRSGLTVHSNRDWDDGHSFRVRRFATGSSARRSARENGDRCGLDSIVVVTVARGLNFGMACPARRQMAVAHDDFDGFSGPVAVWIDDHRLRLDHLSVVIRRRASLRCTTFSEGPPPHLPASAVRQQQSPRTREDAQHLHCPIRRIWLRELPTRLAGRLQPE